MIQIKTNLKVADNTGGKKIICIRVIRRKIARVGIIIIAVVKDTNPNIIIKQSEIIRAVVIRTKKNYRPKSAIWISFAENAAVIINKNEDPRRSRVFGPTIRELRDGRFAKITSLSLEII